MKKVVGVLFVITLLVNAILLVDSFSYVKADNESTLLKTFEPASPQTISGIVYQDYNANGVRDTHEPGIADVTITAYPASATGNTGGVSTTTGADGSFSLATGGGLWRLEVTNLPSGFFEGGGSSTVVFSNDGSSNIEIGINDPAEYVAPDIQLATNIYYHADRSGTNPALLSFDYAAGCVDADLNGSCDNGGSFDSPTPITEATQVDIGTTWGLAYDRNTDTMYVASFMKRHTKFRNHGETGMIYHIHNGVTTLYADLSAYTGTDPHVQYDPGTNQCTGGLGTSWQSQSNDETDCWDHDPDSWDQVGRVGFGDLDISDDMTTLWTINLATRELYQIPITTTNLPLGISDITAYPLPLTASCQYTDDLRPFALAFHKGKVYVGITCTAETSQNRNELQAFVYSTDAATPGTFNLVLSIPLTYNREYAIDANPDSDADWNPWSPTFTYLQSPQFNSGEVAYPQPWLTDIEFDGEDMILGIRDRYGDQMGFRRYSTDYTDNTLYSGDSAGDILKACSNGAGGWTLENNGSCGGNTTGGANNNQGPGGGEFYYQEHYPYHTEISMSGLTNVPGRGEVVENAYDTIYDTNQFFDGGVLWLDNATGQRNRAYRIYDTSPGGQNSGDGTFAKGNGLGDMEYLSAPAPLEIGNRLWCDMGTGADNIGAGNGVQDPGEPPITGATVVLECDTDGDISNGYEATATATTDADGNYLFKDNTGEISSANNWPASTWDSNVFIIPRNASCRILIDPAQTAISDSCGAGNNYGPTLPDNGGSDTGADLRDSDGQENIDGNGNTGITFTTGDNGENDHSLDFGFKPQADYDWGDLPDSFGTLNASSGPSHIITPDLYLGSCVDAETDGQPDPHAGNAGGGSGNGDDGNAGATTGTCTNDDDEDGVTLSSPLIPGAQACVTVSAHNALTSDATLLGWIDFNGDGAFDSSEALTNGSSGDYQFNSGAATVPAGGVSNASYCFEVPANATFDGGETHMRFRLTTDALTSSDWGGPANDGEVEDYWQPLACTGNYVWNDDNGATPNVQDGSDSGINGVEVRLVWAGPDGAIDTAASDASAQNDDQLYTVTTDANGVYNFCGLTPDTYRTEIPSPPAGLQPVTPNSGGNDNQDSDGVATGGVGSPVNGEDFTITDVTALPVNEDGNGDVAPSAGPNNFPDNQVDESRDFGFTSPKVAIGNFVWNDANGNSQFDSGETGIDNITMELFRDADGDGVCEPEGDDGSALATTTTSGGGYYQFLSVTPSTIGDATTYYCVAIVKSDVTAAGYAYSSAGGGHNPDATGDHDAADGDDGVPAGSYVVSQPFAATINGQSSTTDSGDPTGYDDDSAYMTVDFGFLTQQQHDAMGTPTVVHLNDVHATVKASTWGIGLLLLGLAGLSGFIWRRRHGI